MPYNIQITPKGLKEKTKLIADYFKKDYEKAREEFSKILKRNVPIKTGALKRSIKVTRINNELTLYAKKYFLYLDKGTKSHRIKPRSAKVLAFKIGDKTYFSKGHKVRGIKRMNIFQRSKEQLRRFIINQIKNKFR
ncbi:MAG: hypothetical protein KatS3mg003_1068 [Candidatus Nitrosocaldaceae archaeon]|nr:MAG: hypothetical protein KatS3mg003_1068 [Candidatus Nitrosocaldaceae archaeon]